MTGDLRIPVRTATVSYCTAVAAGVLSTRQASAGEAALEVIDGTDLWWERLGEAMRGNALAFIVADPAEAPPDRIAALVRRAQARPVIIERPRLRFDVAGDARRARESSQPLMVVAECSALPSDLPAAVRDAVGWIRILTGGRLEVDASHGTARACVAHFAPQEQHGPSAVLTANSVDAQGSSTFLSVVAVGEARSEVTVDSACGRATISTFTAAGRHMELPRYEESARLSIRRAVEALAEGSCPADLDELFFDSRQADRAVREARQPERVQL